MSQYRLGLLSPWVFLLPIPLWQAVGIGFPPMLVCLSFYRYVVKDKYMVTIGGVHLSQVEGFLAVLISLKCR